MENKKVVYGVIGGVTLLASAGIIYYMMNREKLPAESSSSEEDKADNKCLENIKALGPVKLDKNGKLEFEYLLKFCEVVGRHAKAK